jgi:hypothetical protein
MTALSPAARAALERFKAQQAVTDPDGSPATVEDINGKVGGMQSQPAANQGRREEEYEDAGDAAFGDTGSLFRPEQPKTFEDSGISYRVLEGLVLKLIKQGGPQTEQQLSDSLKLATNVFHDIVVSLNKRELIDTPAPLQYDLTNKGREMVALDAREDGYIGPAPVPFDTYCKMVREQAKREQRITMDDIKRVFADYPMRPELQRTLKEGFNSQRVMLYYGPPGNGKSLITENLHRLLKDPVLLPTAFEFNTKVVTVYDPAFHKLRTDLMEKEEAEFGGGVSTSGKPDRRWLISNPPLVTIGTEFKIAHFEISYDGSYDAPPHLKSNNGILIFDDLGRQTEDHNMILNQFIYPLEQQESIIKFAGGSSMRAPFLQRLFLSTNLNHEEILDDAFKRRLLYQVLVDRPTVPLWKKIFIGAAAKHGLRETEAGEFADHVIKWYEEDDRIFRAVDPRNIFTMIDATLDGGQRASDILDLAMLRRIYDDYPAAFKRDAKFYVGAMDSEDLERPTPSD